MQYFILLGILVLPSLTYASSFQETFKHLLEFTNTRLLPFLIGIGFLFIVINSIRYFVVEGANEDGREKAKRLAIYGTLAFVMIVVFWGLVNLISNSIGLADDTGPKIDYIEEYGGDSPVFKSSGPGESTTPSARKTPSYINPCDTGAAFNEAGTPCGN